MRLAPWTLSLKNMLRLQSAPARMGSKKRRNSPLRACQLETLEDRMLLSAQVISAVPSNLALSPGAAGSFAVDYQTQTDAGAGTNQNSAGVDVKMFYDSSKVTFQTSTNVLQDGLLPITPGVQSDSSDLDSNPATDKYVEFIWNKLTNDFLPNASTPAALYTANFTAAANFSGSTQVDFTGTAANGFSFKSSPVTINQAVLNLTSLTASPSTVTEGDSVTLAGAFTDSNSGLAHTAVINWGDGTPNSTVQIAAGTSTLSAQHKYANDKPSATPANTYTVGVHLTSTTGAADSSTTVTVKNANPVVQSLSVPKGKVGQQITATATFSDAGALDTHTAMIDFGDGTAPVAGTVNETTHKVTASHTYATAGTFMVGMTLTDNSGGSGQSSMSVVIADTAKTPTPPPPVNGGASISVSSDGTTLTIVGTTGAGRVTLSLVNDTFAVSVRGGKTHLQQSIPKENITNVVIDVHAGRNRVAVAKNVDVPTNVIKPPSRHGK